MNQLHVMLYDKIVLTVSRPRLLDISGISLCHWMESAWQPVDQMNQRQQQIEHFHRLMFILCVRAAAAAAAWLVASKLTHEPFQNVCVTAWLFPFHSYIVLALDIVTFCPYLFSNLFVYCLFSCRECASASSTCAFNRILASTEASASTPTRARSASAEILTTTDLFVRKVSAAQLFIHLSIPKWIMLMPWTCKWLSDLGLSIRWSMCDDIND
jgi:hypothetical protein